MAFTIDVSPDGLSFQCLENQTVLEAAINNNINISYGCRSGFCTSCKGKVLAGKVKGNFESLKQESDPAFVLFCQAIPLSDLTIEINKIAVRRSTEICNFPARVLHSDYNQFLRLKIPANESFLAEVGQTLMVSVGSTKALYEVSEMIDQTHQFIVKLISEPDKASAIWKASLVQVQGPFN